MYDALDLVYIVDGSYNEDFKNKNNNTPFLVQKNHANHIYYKILWVSHLDHQQKTFLKHEEHRQDNKQQQL